MATIKMTSWKNDTGQVPTHALYLCDSKDEARCLALEWRREGYKARVQPRGIRSFGLRLQVYVVCVREKAERKRLKI